MALVQKALFVRLIAKPGREADVAQFLMDALATVNEEQGTVTWYALRFDESTFAIFDTFGDETGRQNHLGGKVAASLTARAEELFANPLSIMSADVLAAK